MAIAVGKKGLSSNINIAPYIDILLTLLVIFMIVTPVRQMDLTVRVPKSAPEKQEPVAPANAIVVSVGEDDQIAINRQPVSFSTLGARLEEIYSARTDKTMFISASPDLPYGDVVRVIDIAKGAGVGPVGLMTEDVGKG